MSTGDGRSFAIPDLGTNLVALSLVHNNGNNETDAYVNGIDVISFYTGVIEGGYGNGIVFFGGSNGNFASVELLTGTFPGSAPADAPEPAPLALLGSGIAGLLAVRRRHS